MRSYREVRTKLAGVNKLITTDDGEALELLATEMEALQWVLEGPKRYSFNTIRELINVYSAKNDTYINGFELVKYLEMKLGEPKKEIKIE